MYELVQVSEKCYYINCLAKIGVYVADRILSICKEPMCFERILQEVFKGYGLSMNFEQYAAVAEGIVLIIRRGSVRFINKAQKI